MARLTLSGLTTEVQLVLPSMEEADVKAAANMFLRRLGRHDLSFTRTRTTLTTTEPVDTTVTVNKGSASVTCTDAASTWLGQVVKITGSDQWFSIATVDAGVGFTISSLFDGDNVSGGAAEVAFPRIALDADIIDVEAIKPVTWDKLSIVSSEVNINLSDNAKLGQPFNYSMVEPVNTDDKLEIFLTDFPDAIYTYTLIGRNRITRFAGSSDSCGVPERYEDILIGGTLYFLYMGDDPKGEVARMWFAFMEEGIEDINKAAKMGQAVRGRMLGVDQAASTKLMARFPAEGAS